MKLCYTGWPNNDITLALLITTFANSQIAQKHRMDVSNHYTANICIDHRWEWTSSLTELFLTGIPTCQLHVCDQGPVHTIDCVQFTQWDQSAALKLWGLTPMWEARSPNSLNFVHTLTWADTHTLLHQVRKWLDPLTSLCISLHVRLLQAHELFHIVRRNKSSHTQPLQSWDKSCRKQKGQNDSAALKRLMKMNLLYQRPLSLLTCAATNQDCARTGAFTVSYLAPFAWRSVWVVLHWVEGG